MSNRSTTGRLRKSYQGSLVGSQVLRLATLCGIVLCLAAHHSARAQNNQSELIRQALQATIEQEKIPGMVAAITDADGVLAIASAGIRKAGSKEEFSPTDLIHIGSCTKAMTSALMAVFVEKNLISWDTTLIEVFPEYRSKIHPDYHQVTLWQLLSHRAGLPANAEDWWVHRRKKVIERRQTIMLENCSDAPKGKAGDYLYSNLGYMIAGCMAEKIGRKSWEELIEKHLFQPLQMKSAGFGPPGSERKADQPWGHVRSGNQWTPKHFDNAEALGPAGRVHCSVEDWAKFVALQMPESSSLLKRESLNTLITPQAGEYAGGWIVVKRPWAKGTALTHSGSNTMWYCVVWAAPEINRAYLVATNSRDDKTPKICDQFIGKLIEIDQK